MMKRRLCIYTDKFEETIRFYEVVTGLKVEKRIKSPGGNNLAFMLDEDNESALEIEEDFDNPFNGAGITWGFITEDVEAKYEQIKSLGVYEVQELVTPFPGMAFFFVKDPNGLLIHFIKA